jgi:hypothetical protein
MLLAWSITTPTIIEREVLWRELAKKIHVSRVHHFPFKGEAMSNNLLMLSISWYAQKEDLETHSYTWWSFDQWYSDLRRHWFQLDVSSSKFFATYVFMTPTNSWDENWKATYWVQPLQQCLAHWWKGCNLPTLGLTSLLWCDARILIRTPSPKRMFHQRWPHLNDIQSYSSGVHVRIRFKEVIIAYETTFLWPSIFSCIYFEWFKTWTFKVVTMKGVLDMKIVYRGS